MAKREVGSHLASFILRMFPALTNRYSVGAL
jgi:hypothetical protein